MAIAVSPSLPVPVSDGEVLRENEEAWQRIEGSDVREPLKTALRLVACGYAYRQAAKAVGYASHSGVYEAAQRFGLATANSARLVANFRSVAGLATEELVERLETNPGDFSVKELGITAGIATDKIAKWERWGSDDTRGQGAESALERLVRAAEEGKLSLDVRVTPVQGSGPPPENDEPEERS